MSKDLMVLDFGGVALPYDQNLAAQLVQEQTAGLAGQFKKAARLTMGNSGDWELVDENGEIHDMGREVNIVVVDQRKTPSRVHYGMTFDEQKASGEFSPPDCQSADGTCPDRGVENPLADKCANCAFNKISSNYVDGNQPCNVYRRIVAVLANQDGTFSDPFVLDPKYKSLSGDKTVVQGRFGSWTWYMNTLAQQKMPIPVQAVVTRCMPMPKMETATMKFGVASNAAGGYWVLTKEQMDYILQLKESDEVKELLEPMDTAFNNPSSAGRIEVKQVPSEPKQASKVEGESALTSPSSEPKQEAPKPKPAPKAKTPEPKKVAPAPKKKTKMVVLGLEHPDVKNSEDYEYSELVEWAKEVDEADVKEFLADNFPQALEPVEVPDDSVEEAPKPKPAPKKAPTKKAAETPLDNVIDTTGATIDPALASAAQKLAEDLDAFDD